MFTKFKRSSRVLFLDRESKEITLMQKGERLTLILSPSLYWVKRITIPVKSSRELIKLLPSLFIDTLPDGNYSYSAYKKGSDFIAFAYEDKKIIEFLAAKGISLADVKAIYFAQSEFEDSKDAFEINATESIYSKDGIVVVMPTLWLAATKKMDLSDIELSKHTIKLQQFGHLVDNRSFYKIGAILVAFIFILSVELFLTASKIADVESEKDLLFSKYKLQPTVMQNRSSYKKYLKMHIINKNLRASIALFLTMPLKVTQKIESIVFKERKLFVEISGVPKGSEQGILSKLNAKNIKYKTSFHNDRIRVELVI